MELEKQVCSLELAKRLKELGESAMRWKSIPGYDGLYEVSDNGAVRAIKRSGSVGGILRQHRSKGYLQVWLSKQNRVTRLAVHRAVLMAFDRLPIPQEVCNHKDGNKENNSLLNLEWCTREYSEAHKKGVLGHDGKGEKNANYGYRHAKLYPSAALRNRLCELGVPRNRHNLAELGDMLPMSIFSHKHEFDKDIWVCTDLDQQQGAIFSFECSTEADARAKMLIYLIEQGLVKP